MNANLRRVVFCFSLSVCLSCGGAQPVDRSAPETPQTDVGVIGIKNGNDVTVAAILSLNYDGNRADHNPPGRTLEYLITTLDNNGDPVAEPFVDLQQFSLEYEHSGVVGACADAATPVDCIEAIANDELNRQPGEFHVYRMDAYLSSSTNTQAINDGCALDLDPMTYTDRDSILSYDGGNAHRAQLYAAAGPYTTVSGTLRTRAVYELFFTEANPQRPTSFPIQLVEGLQFGSNSGVCAEGSGQTTGEACAVDALYRLDPDPRMVVLAQVCVHELDETSEINAETEWPDWTTKPANPCSVRSYGLTCTQNCYREFVAHMQAQRPAPDACP